MIKPVYDMDGITLYQGDSREVLPQVASRVAVIATDPPYGINHPTDYHTRGRGKLAKCSNYPPVLGDNEKFDPRWILNLDKPTCLWGANYFADALPPTSGWLIWDKERPDELDQATVEMAWTNFVKGARRFRFMWNGMLRASDEALLHPTQKPVALSKWVLTLRWTPQGTVADPYAGSGSTLLAAKQLGRQAIGVELSEKYCSIIIKRLSQTTIFQEMERSRYDNQRIVV